MPKFHVLTPIAAAALAVVLAACSEPADKQADFSLPTDQPTAAHQPAVAPGIAPTEVTHDERSMPLVATTECNLERANGVVFSGVPIPVNRGEPLKLSGWVADVESNRVPAGADLRFTGSNDNRAFKVAVQPGKQRDDVVKLLGGNVALGKSGYVAEVDLSALPSGSYRLFVTYASNGGQKSCDNGRAITIAE